MTKTIFTGPLDAPASVCDDCFEAVRAEHWTNRLTNGPYRRPVNPRTKKKGQITLARQILELHGCPIPDGMVVVHKDRDLLNCKYENLAIATPQQARWRKRPTTASKSGLKGVIKRSRDYMVQIKRPGNSMVEVVGFFATKEEAAEAYDSRAYEYFGKWAYFNFPANWTWIWDERPPDIL